MHVLLACCASFGIFLFFLGTCIRRLHADHLNSSPHVAEFHSFVTALSIAAALHPPTPIIRSLLEAYDDAACFTDENDDTALLCSLMNTNSRASLHDDSDRTNNNNPSEANTLLILDANPMAASIPSKASGKLPVHFAASVSTASALVREHPAGIARRDGRGRIPLHWSVDPDANVVQYRHYWWII